LLLEASGEVKKICPKCKTENHVVTTSQGIIQLNSK
jgi:phage FluMu protein Com